MKVSFDLYDTIEQNEHIQEVYFAKNNTHYFNRHPLNGKFYGFLKLEKVHSHTIGSQSFYKMVSRPNPDAEIVETMSREQILESDPVEVSEIFTTSRTRKAKPALKASK